MDLNPLFNVMHYIVSFYSCAKPHRRFGPERPRFISFWLVEAFNRDDTGFRCYVIIAVVVAHLCSRTMKLHDICCLLVGSCRSFRLRTIQPSPYKNDWSLLSGSSQSVLTLLISACSEKLYASSLEVCVDLGATKTKYNYWSKQNRPFENIKTKPLKRLHAVLSTWKFFPYHSFYWDPRLLVP